MKSARLRTVDGLQYLNYGRFYYRGNWLQHFQCAVHVVPPSGVGRHIWLIPYMYIYGHKYGLRALEKYGSMDGYGKKIWT
jgi:hypothetical protein